MKSIVYFTKEVGSDAVLKIYKKLGIELKGNVAVKVHSGEPGNQNFFHAEYFKPIVDYVDGTIVECNTAYSGERDTTEAHLKTLKDHGFIGNFKVDLMDKDPNKDIEIDIKDGFQIKKNYLGESIKNYDSLLVVSHFKGHPMGGFGGALKQLSIGCASKYGKKNIHGAGNTSDNYFETDHDKFLISMADAAYSVCKLFDGKCAFINVMKNLSVDCDCCSVAEDPCMKDIGTLASLDPIAIDQACIDLIYNSKDPGRDHFVERVESRHGLLTLEYAEKHHFGSRQYELVDIDE